MRPLEPGELLEYGQLFVCGCSRVPTRDGCNRAITIHGAMLALAIVLAVYSGVLCGVAQLASVPWITLTGFNGTVDDASTFRADDRYALDGSVQSTLCPVAPTLNARCCENPPWHVSPRLTDLAPSADAGAAFAHMQLLGILAQVLWAVAALVLVFLLAPNFVRGMAIPVTALWLALKPSMGVIPATLAVGFATIALGLASLVGMRESFDNDLDFLEE